MYIRVNFLQITFLLDIDESSFRYYRFHAHVIRPNHIIGPAFVESVPGDVVLLEILSHENKPVINRHQRAVPVQMFQDGLKLLELLQVLLS